MGGMQMTGSNSIFAIPAEHVPGLVALLLFPLAAWCAVAVVRAGARRDDRVARALDARIKATPFAGRVALVAMLAGAVVHAAIVPTHWGDSRVLALLFIADAIGFLAASVWLLAGRRHWRAASFAMLAGTVGGYVFYLLMGWETPDPVGLSVTGIELVGALVLVMPALASSRASVRRRQLWASIPLAAVTLLGAVLLAGGSSATTAKSAAAGQRAPMSSMKGGSTGSMNGMTGGAGPSGTMPPMTSTGSSTMPPMSGDPTGSNGSSGAMPSMNNGTSAAAMPNMPADPAPGGGTSTMPGMPGMPGGGSGPSGKSISLPTSSPAGPIVWPLPMGSMGPGMQMVTPDCTTVPTAAQQQAAVALVDQTVTGIQRYQSLANAKADGYIPITPSGAPVVHYAKPAFINDGKILDPGAIESLVYANTPHGAVLVAAMYLMGDNQVGAQPPMPGGCLTEWHVHTNLCFSDATGIVVGVTNGGSCAAGSNNHVTQPMIHVWLAPVPGGPLVVDASNAQAVQAAEQLPVPSPPNGTA